MKYKIVVYEVAEEPDLGTETTATASLPLIRKVAEHEEDHCVSPQDAVRCWAADLEEEP